MTVESLQNRNEAVCRTLVRREMQSDNEILHIYVPSHTYNPITHKLVLLYADQGNKQILVFVSKSQFLRAEATILITSFITDNGVQSLFLGEMTTFLIT